MGSTVSDIFGAPTSLGGNVTSDATGDSGLINKTVEETFRFEWRTMVDQDFRGSNQGDFIILGIQDATHKVTFEADGAHCEFSSASPVITLYLSPAYNISSNKNKVRVTVTCTNYISGNAKVDNFTSGPLIIDGNGTFIKEVDASDVVSDSFNLLRNASPVDLTIQSVKIEYYQNTFKPIYDSYLAGAAIVPVNEKDFEGKNRNPYYDYPGAYTINDYSTTTPKSRGRGRGRGGAYNL